LLTSALRTKDIQLYFDAPQAEALLAHASVASTIVSPAGDSLFVVDANILANKANDFMTYTLRDEITIDAKGTATHTTTLTYSWPISQRSSNNNYGSLWLYRDYLRVYTPPGSVLISQAGWSPVGASKAFGRTVWAGIFSLPYGKTQQVTLKWQAPNAATK